MKTKSGINRDWPACGQAAGGWTAADDRGLVGVRDRYAEGPERGTGAAVRDTDLDVLVAARIAGTGGSAQGAGAGAEAGPARPVEDAEAQVVTIRIAGRRGEMISDALCNTGTRCA